jgi:hypothetical protein
MGMIMIFRVAVPAGKTRGKKIGNFEKKTCRLALLRYYTLTGKLVS